MNGVIMYQSKYGATKIYAEWLAEALALPLVNVKEQPAVDWAQYEFVIFASPMYMGRLVIAKYLKKHWPLLQAKKLYLLVVGATPPEKIQDLETALTAGLGPAYLQTMRWYYAVGRLAIEQLPAAFKFILKMVASFEKNEHEQEKLKHGFDGIRREHLHPMIADITKAQGAAAQNA